MSCMYVYTCMYIHIHVSLHVRDTRFTYILHVHVRLTVDMCTYMTKHESSPLALTLSALDTCPHSTRSRPINENGGTEACRFLCGNWSVFFIGRPSIAGTDRSCRCIYFSERCTICSLYSRAISNSCRRFWHPTQISLSFLFSSWFETIFQ